MSILLSLLAAASYGLGDFNGGIFSERGGAVGGLAGGPVGRYRAGAWSGRLCVGGSPNGTDFAWAFGGGVATASVPRSSTAGSPSGRDGGGGAGLGRRRGAGAGRGRCPHRRAARRRWCGSRSLLALPAIWLVSREPLGGPVSVPTPGARAPASLDGVLAGLGFGTLFAALWPRSPRRPGSPLALNQLIAGGPSSWSPWCCTRTGCPATAMPLGGVDQRRSRRAGHRALPGRDPARLPGRGGGDHLALPGVHGAARRDLVLREHVHRTQAYRTGALRWSGGAGGGGLSGRPGYMGTSRA